MIWQRASGEKLEKSFKQGEKFVKNMWLLSISVICLMFIGCKDSARSYPVDFVDRSAVFALGKKPNPLILPVEIDENGKLSLNKIETGTIDDITELSEKLKAIFDDRQRREAMNEK